MSDCPQIPLNHRRGATFRFSGALTDDDGVPVNLSSYELKSQVRTQDGRRAFDAVVTKYDQAQSPGEFDVVVQDTHAWPITMLYVDVLMRLGDETTITQSFSFHCVRPATEDTP